MNLNDLLVILPVTIVIAWAVLLLLADLWIPKRNKGLTAFLAALGMAVAAVTALTRMGSIPAGEHLSGFGGMVVMDGFGLALQVIFLGAGVAGVALACDYLKRMGIERGEYYALLMFAVSGMMLMAQSFDLVMIFISLELLSLPLYVLAGLARPRLDSEESSLKYFFLGAFSSGFVLYGIALIFGATASTNLGAIMEAVSGHSFNLILFLVGAGLLLVGLGFKVALVPFHMWSPDVYQGAPTPVTGFMSVGAKAAGIAALLRVFLVAFPSISAQMTPVLWGLAAVTMVVGNLLAVTQTNIKRLLAYSSIASAGYLLMAFVPYGNPQMSAQVISSMLFYLVAYAVTSFGAWAVVTSVEQAEGRGLELEDYAGLGRKYPWIGVVMVIFLLSYAGVPLTLGFWGKYYLFTMAVQGGFPGLALVGLLTSVVAAYYYLRIIVMMFMRSGEPRIRRDLWLSLTALLAAALVLLLAFAPNLLLHWISQAVMGVG